MIKSSILQISDNKYNLIAFTGLMGAVCVVLGAMENFIPLPLVGVRLGLANVGIMLVIYLAGYKPALTVALVKVLLVPLVSGNLIFRFSLGVPSGLAAFCVMAAVHYILGKKISAVSVGVAGAMAHMITQLFIIDKLYISGLFSTVFTGWFMLAAVFTGVLTGLVVNIVMKRIEFIFYVQKTY